VEVILFGDEDGAAQAACELNLRHQPYVGRSECGMKRLDYMFATARAIARHEVLCYINCDIILMQDFRRALECVEAAHRQFLMVGRRWDVDITQPCDFARANWQSQLQSVALLSGLQRPSEWIDYFAFSCDLYGSSVPPFVVGRVHWDDWLVWKALDLKQPVVDVSAAVMAVHQNHDYGYHPEGHRGTLNDKEARRNLCLAGGYKHLRTIDCAPLRLTGSGLTTNPWHGLAYWRWRIRRPVNRVFMSVWTPLQSHFLHPLLDLTRPLRRTLGLRSTALRRSRGDA
jgi:hypothetical protein